MINFEDLKSQWSEQPQGTIPHNGASEIIKTATLLKKKRQITILILTITAVILMGFFFYIAAYRNNTVITALILMVGALLSRVFIETLSVFKLNKIKATINSKTFKENVVTHYRNRIKTHYIATPVIFVLYTFGFFMLLPLFKQELSYGFYLYVVVSGIIVLVVLAFFIGKQILKELSIIKELSKVD
ncbi:hypothetical protein [Seonamhaeicola marinus]|uniref:DUF3278 domain-containing protein n=1 Tax=Seonamhaeicola marinus TaxID=1912246 RepID=A0A5D0HRY1_9FLAO|nr:hypothetical protein [Seonamhaeicola marinus]TYA74096.1 hypothetical protein FUA24_12175 [Seonamhaeicola marinus]